MDKNSSASSEAVTNPNERNSQTDKKEFLKQDILKYYTQLAKGCFRDVCYNRFCKKSNLVTLRTSELTAEAFRLALSNSSTNNYCMENKDLNQFEKFDSSLLNLGVNKNVENLAMNFFNCSIDKITSPKELYSGLRFDYALLKFYYKKYTETNHSIEELGRINAFFSEQLLNMKNLANYSTDLKIYLVYLYTRLLIYIALHPNFCYNESEPQIQIFFENYKSYRKLAKELRDNDQLDILGMYSDIPKEIIEEIIRKFNDFVTCLFLSETRKEIDLLIVFMKAFHTIYEVNEKFKRLPYKEFYNDSLNKHLDIERDFQIYLKKMKQTQKKEKEFCLLKYSWLFDSVSKKEVLEIYHLIQQKDTVFSEVLQGNSNNIHGFTLTFEIRRKNMIEDTLNLVHNSNMNFRKPLRVKFIGEQGIDQGGVRKEFFLLVMRQLFDVEYGMFSYYESSRLFWFKSHTFESTMKYELIGIIMGLGMFNNVLLDVKFPLVVYKKLLNLKPTLEDFKDLDIDVYKSLQYISEYENDDLEEALGVNFTVSVNNWGHEEQVLLKENGDQIYVNQSNKREYLDLYVDWFFNKSIDIYFKNFYKGFYRVSDERIIKFMRPEELEQVICGNPELNFQDLQSSARYEDGYTEESQTIKSLWEILHEMTQEDKKKFLFFVTGCDRAPINGLRDIVIKIHRNSGDSDNLPSAHTCFNSLMLPDYESREKLKKLLLIAIQNSEGFGLM